MYNLCLTDYSETCTKEQPLILSDPLVHPFRWLGQISLKSMANSHGVTRGGILFGSVGTCLPAWEVS